MMAAYVFSDDPQINRLMNQIAANEYNPETINQLSAMGEIVVDPVLAAFRIPYEGPRDHRDWEDDLREVIVNLGAVVVPRLIDELVDPTGRLRFDAAWMLGGIGDERAVRPLRSVLNDASEWLRWAALTALAKFALPSLAPVFVQHLDDSFDLARTTAEQMLGEQGDASTLGLLREFAATTSSAEARLRATRAADAIRQRLMS